MSKKMFISLPMRDLSIEEIRRRQKGIYEIVNSVTEDEYELIDSIITDELDNPDNKLWYLGRSIQILGEADLAIFAVGWTRAKGCVIEHSVCKSYNIPIMDERDAIDLLGVTECVSQEEFFYNI